MGALGRWALSGQHDRIIIAGWSEGAGLALLGAASEENKKTFCGLVAIGLGETNVLAWRWTDYFSYLTKRDPKNRVSGAPTMCRE